MKLLFKGLALLLATATAASSAAEGGSRILIYNGDDVVAGTYPWFAYPFNLSTGDWDGCGGSLISAEYVLTAAHCIIDVFGDPWDSLDAYYIGALCDPYTQQNNCGQDVEVVPIVKSTVHPSYGGRDNDFALVKLKESASTTPVNIDDGTYSPAYANGEGNLWPIGFGKATLDDSPGEVHYPERLQHVEVKYITNAKCVADYGFKATEITDNMMCAADTPSEYRSPLQEFLFRRCDVPPSRCLYFIVGVSSLGKGCGLDKYPGVYARILTQFDWIKSVVCNDHSVSTIPAWCETTQVECNDSPLRFILFDGGKVHTCNWVSKDTSVRCKKYGVSSHCPSTCNACAAYHSSDSMKKWMKTDSKGPVKKCKWVARKLGRCRLPGVADTCREVCA